MAKKKQLAPTASDESARIPLLYDTELRRPACVLLQAAVGGDTGLVNRLWRSDVWLVAPTPGMRALLATREQWEALAEQDMKLPRKSRS